MATQNRAWNLTDYEATRRSFRWDAPAQFNFATDVFDRWAEDGSRLALYWVGDGEERQLTFRSLSLRSNRLANALAGLGLGPGERVLVMLPRIVAWWESLLGLEKARLVAMPGTVLLTPKDIAYRLEAAEASALITDAANADKVDALPQSADLKARIVVGHARPGWHSYETLLERARETRAPQPTPADEPALLYFTSGTTGQPKMVIHTHSSYGFAHRATGRFWLDLRPGDLHWNISDTGWAKAAWSSFFGPWSCGATVFAQHSPGKFAPSAIPGFLSAYPITTLCAAPTVYRMLVQEDLSAVRRSTLRHCVAAGEPLNPEVIATWQAATGLTIRDGYGQTETVILCGNFPPLPVRAGSMGKPTPGFDLAIVDQEGRRLPAGQEGDLAVRVEPERPAGLFVEYWKNPAATAASFHHGWYITGDRGMVDEDGYFWFVGRADDVIISAGYRIGPFEVESALIEHPAVIEAAAVASPDPVRGSVVKAFVVLAQGFQASDALVHELQEQVKRTTAPYKYPREIEFVPELPKTISGKIRRVELRELERARKLGQRSAPLS
jgi:acetyl-CoA synthetase/medium-chain acyl-CoA synthetase